MCSHCGKKYFGKTIRSDPFKYLGSGKHWINHYNKHGKEHIVTIGVYQFEDQEKCTKFALEFSERHNIVESEKWFNKVPENGTDGWVIGIKHTDVAKLKISNSNKGRKRTSEQRENYRQCSLNRSEEHANKIAEANKIKSICPIINDKIKETMLERYGVNHPSYSSELLNKKKQNNFEKYGHSNTLQVKIFKDKTNKTMLEKYGTTVPLHSDIIKNRIRKTCQEKYGVSWASKDPEFKEKVLETRGVLSNREIVILIREYKRVFDITIGCGWYQNNDLKLNDILKEIQDTYGYFTLDYLSTVEVVKETQYSNSIKKLQSREVVKDILIYKNQLGRNLQLGKNWYRKSEEYLNEILKELQIKYPTLAPRERILDIN